ncbi:MAG: ABC transporter permease, partial [Solirubrobacterales bacterium]
MTLADDTSARGARAGFSRTGASRISAATRRHARRLGRSADVLLALSLADLKARYGRGRARFIKWLLDPFALVGVYMVFVVFLLDRPGEAPGLSLACAVVPFNVLMMTVMNSMVTVQFRRSIVLNLGFKRSLLPPSSALTETMGFGASLVLLAIMMAVYGIAPTWSILWLPVAIGITVLFAVSCAYGGLLFGVWFPELINLARSGIR